MNATAKAEPGHTGHTVNDGSSRDSKDSNRLATLEESNGRCTLRFVRALDHPLEVVWRAITEPEQLLAWFPTSVEYLSWDGAARAGAPIRFTMPDGQVPPFDGEVVTFEPPTVLELRWGTDVLRFELHSDDEGTLLTLLDTFTDKGKAARDGAGWHVCLDALVHALAHPSDGEADGTDRPPASQDAHEASAFDQARRWVAVHPAYVQALGPEASTMGPPDGYDPR